MNRGPDEGINTISADASATTILAMWDKRVLVFYKEGFQLSTPSQW